MPRGHSHMPFHAAHHHIHPHVNSVHYHPHYAHVSIFFIIVVGILILGAATGLGVWAYNNVNTSKSSSTQLTAGHKETDSPEHPPK